MPFEVPLVPDPVVVPLPDPVVPLAAPGAPLAALGAPVTTIPEPEDRLPVSGTLPAPAVSLAAPGAAPVPAPGAPLTVPGAPLSPTEPGGVSPLESGASVEASFTSVKSPDVVAPSPPPSDAVVASPDSTLAASVVRAVSPLELSPPDAAVVSPRPLSKS